MEDNQSQLDRTPQKESKIHKRRDRKNDKSFVVERAQRYSGQPLVGNPIRSFYEGPYEFFQATLVKVRPLVPDESGKISVVETPDLGSFDHVMTVTGLAQVSIVGNYKMWKVLSHDQCVEVLSLNAPLINDALAVNSGRYVMNYISSPAEPLTTMSQAYSTFTHISSSWTADAILSYRDSTDENAAYQPISSKVSYCFRLYSEGLTPGVVYGYWISRVTVCLRKHHNC